MIMIQTITHTLIMHNL